MMAKRKLTKTDREFLDQMGRNAERTRQLALAGEADLIRRGVLAGPVYPVVPEPRTDRQQLDEMAARAEYTRQLAIKGQAELDRKKQLAG
jgi:hypothetical protein